MAMSGAAASRLTAHYLIAREWVFMAPVMALGLLAAAILKLAVPPVAVLVLTLAAIGITSATRRFLDFERSPGRNAVTRYVVAILAIALPMQLFGFGIALWVSNGTLDWTIAMSVMVITAAVVSISLTSRLPSMVAAQIALWTGMCLISASLPAIVALLIGCGIGVLSAVLQAQRDRAIDARQQELERAQARAEELLAEYEQTGQGWFWETDRRGTISYLSPTISRMLGRKRPGTARPPFHRAVHSRS